MPRLREVGGLGLDVLLLVRQGDPLTRRVRVRVAGAADPARTGRARTSATLARGGTRAGTGTNARPIPSGVGLRIFRAANVRSVRLGTAPLIADDSGMTPRDWPTRLKGCRTSVTGTLRGVLSFDASGRDTRTLAVIPVLAPLLPALEPDRVRLAGSFAAPVAAPPRRRGCSFDCE